MRFIPTYVGHTCISAPRSGGCPVHPHLRGAYMGRPAKIYVKNGSSPHTWGIQHSAFPSCPLRRFIPTYVGHTSTGRCPSQSGRFIPTYVGYTSAPFWAYTAPRFIPTYVGYTMPPGPLGAPVAVHPHIRGVYYHPPGAYHRPPGSSPHTWGIRKKLICSNVSPTVHPHIRGVYPRTRLFTGSRCGSSPHTWGILSHTVFLEQFPRFIPTYVGYTSHMPFM